MLKNGHPLTQMDKNLLEKLKTALETEKSTLEKELESFATKDKNIKDNWETRYPNRDNGTMEEEADETQEYDNLLSLEQNLELKLKDVNLALEKIKTGEYGKCEKCGKEIEEQRLSVCPEARLCVKCNENK